MRAQPRQAPVQAPRMAERVQPQRSEVAPRTYSPRYGASAAVAPRVNNVPQYGGRAMTVAPRAIPRSGGGAVTVAPRAVPRVAPRGTLGYNGGTYAYRGGNFGYRGSWSGYHGYTPFRPYLFRPWYRFSFGLFVGYPVAYYAYPYPVPVYGYGAPYDAVDVGPTSAYGGVALEFTPGNAAVSVDGTYAGIVQDFDGSREPLTLTAGVHHIEIDLNGYQPIAFDVTVQPGQVIPYQGSMQPY